VTAFKEQNMAPSVWMAPQEWHKYQERFSLSSQIIQLKVNLYSAFESQDEKSILILKELLKWPNNENFSIPKVRFDSIKRNLTKLQMQNYLSPSDRCP